MQIGNVRTSLGLHLVALQRPNIFSVHRCIDRFNRLGIEIRLNGVSLPGKPAAELQRVLEAGGITFSTVREFLRALAECHNEIKDRSGTIDLARFNDGRKITWPAVMELFLPAEVDLADSPPVVAPPAIAIEPSERLEADRLENDGKDLLRDGKYCEGRELLLKAAEAYEKLREMEKVANLYYFIARNLANGSKYLEAYAFYLQAAEVFHGMGDGWKREQAFALSYTAGALRKAGEIQTEVELRESAIELYGELGLADEKKKESIYLVNAYGLYIEFCLANDKYNRAGRVLDKAILLCRTAGLDDMRAKLMSHAGRHFINAGIRLKKGELLVRGAELSLESVDLFDASTQKSDRAFSVMRAGEAYIEFGFIENDPDQLIKGAWYADLAVKMFRGLGLKNEEGLCLTRVGKALLEAGIKNKDHALLTRGEEAVEQAIFLFRAVGNRKEAGYAHLRIGKAYADLGIIYGDAEIILRGIAKAEEGARAFSGDGRLARDLAFARFHIGRNYVGAWRIRKERNLFDNGIRNLEIAAAWFGRNKEEGMQEKCLGIIESALADADQEKAQ